MILTSRRCQTRARDHYDLPHPAGADRLRGATILPASGRIACA